MLLAIDVGNTNITFGIFEEDKLKSNFRITTNPFITSDEIGVKIENIVTSKGYKKIDIEDIIISSVVPSIMDSLVSGLKTYMNINPIILKNDMNFGIKLNVDYPNEVGMDRIINMVAVKNRYGLPSIVIDFGTATTYDYIDEDANYIAGIIAPGIKTSLYGLVKKAAKLTNVEIEFPKNMMAKNTVDSMKSGLMYGQLGQAKYIVENMKSNNADANVIITGGLGEMIADKFGGAIIYDKELTLYGLNYVYKICK